MPIRAAAGRWKLIAGCPPAPRGVAAQVINRVSQRPAAIIIALQAVTAAPSPRALPPGTSHRPTTRPQSRLATLKQAAEAAEEAEAVTATPAGADTRTAGVTRNSQRCLA